MATRTGAAETLEAAARRLAAAPAAADRLVHLVRGDRCHCALVDGAGAPRHEDAASRCLDPALLPPDLADAGAASRREDRASGRPDPFHPRPGASVPAVVICDVGGASPKARKKKRRAGPEGAAGVARSQSCRRPAPPSLPRLRPPEDAADHRPGPPIWVHRASSDEGEADDDGPPPAPPPAHAKKRRKSLVNLLFSSSSSHAAASPPPAPSKGGEFDLRPNALDPGMTPHGQRLHFRRLSDILCRLGGHRDDRDERDERDERDADRAAPAGDRDDAPDSPPASAPGLTLRQLFPYRRRRSSVSHLDNTDQVGRSRSRSRAKKSLVVPLL